MALWVYIQASKTLKIDLGGKDKLINIMVLEYDAK